MGSRKKNNQITKLTPPASKNVLQRERLFHLLDKGQDFPVIYVSSPPGSGKTILVSSYLENRTLPCMWYRIDRGDADIATFFHYMSLAVMQETPKYRKPLPLFSPEYIKSIPTFTRSYFEAVFQRLRDHHIFVLDNYQEVTFSTEFHEMLIQALEIIPQSLNMIIVSRKEPPGSFARLIAEEKIFFLAWKDLRFTYEEFGELIRMKGGSVSEKNLGYLYKKLEGWPAGITLILESLRKGATDQQLIARIPPTEVFNYFAHEIFEKEDEETREFLLRTAFLPRMTAQLAEDLTGRRNSEEILSALHRNNYFVERYIQKEPVYQYHPLFREFLLSIQKDLFPSNEIYHRQQMSAELLERYGHIEDAARLFCDSHSVEGLNRVLRNNAHIFIEGGRHQTLLEWISCIPHEIFSNEPWLLYWKGVCLLPSKPAESKGYFEESFNKFRAQKDATGSFLAWAGLVDSLIYGSESLAQIDGWLFILDDLVKEYQGFPSAPVEAAVTANMVRALSLRKPSSYRMEQWIHRMNEIVRKTSEIPLKIRALTTLACYLYSCGEFQKMGIHIVAINEMLKRSVVPGLLLHTINWVKAAYYNMLSEFGECQKTVREGIALADKTGIHVMDFMLMGHGVMSALKQKDITTAQEFLGKMEPLSGMAKPWEASFFYYTAAWEAFYSGHISRASLLSEKCLDMCQEIGNPWTLSHAYLLRAHILFRHGEHKKAGRHVAKARQISMKTKNKFTYFCCTLSDAYFALVRKEETQALGALREGLRIGSTEGFLNMYMSPPDALERVCVHALESGIEATYVQDVIKKNKVFPDSTSIGIESWPYPLRIYTMGGFALERDTKPVVFSGKVQQKPLLLLKTLVASRKNSMGELQITDLLWPEAAGDAAHSAFTTNLSRLRKILGIEHAIKLKEGKVSIDTNCCWVDAWAFERCADRAESLWTETTPSSVLQKEAIWWTERAENLYKGSFLPSDEEYFWSIPVRDRLQEKFHNMVIRCGSYLEGKGHWKDAVQYFEKALEKDELAESFYQHLMVCHARLGQQTRAVKVYRRFREILSKSMGIGPSQKTEDIYRGILQESSLASSHK